MQRRSFVLRLKEGMEQEYVRRHQEIWPEMLEMLREAGIYNYSIWLCQGKLFGYYQSDDLAKTDEYKARHVVQVRWNDFMADIISSNDSDGSQIPRPECVFLME